jgi:hypothetical protein
MKLALCDAIAHALRGARRGVVCCGRRVSDGRRVVAGRRDRSFRVSESGSGVRRETQGVTRRKPACRVVLTQRASRSVVALCREMRTQQLTPARDTDASVHARADRGRRRGVAAAPDRCHLRPKAWEERLEEAASVEIRYCCRSSMVVLLVRQSSSCVSAGYRRAGFAAGSALVREAKDKLLFAPTSQKSRSPDERRSFSLLSVGSARKCAVSGMSCRYLRILTARQRQRQQSALLFWSPHSSVRSPPRPSQPSLPLPSLPSLPRCFPPRCCLRCPPPQAPPTDRLCPSQARRHRAIDGRRRLGVRVVRLRAQPAGG